MEFDILYEDKNLLVIDKPAEIIVYSERQTKQKNLIGELLKKYPYLRNAGEKPRYGIVHRLDKNTSGILLIAKNNKTLNFLQKEFKARRVKKKYIALVVGKIKENFGTIKTLIGRSKKNRKKQKIYLPNEPSSGAKREAKTYYRVVKRFREYSLLEIEPKTGRKHQIRAHFAYLHHPIAGDKIYGFKNQPCPKKLSRQFLHASYLKIKLPNRPIKEFKSRLPKELSEIIKNIETKN